MYVFDLCRTYQVGSTVHTNTLNRAGRLILKLLYNSSAAWVVHISSQKWSTYIYNLTCYTNKIKMYLSVFFLCEMKKMKKKRIMLAILPRFPTK